MFHSFLVHVTVSYFFLPLSVCQKYKVPDVLMAKFDQGCLLSATGEKFVPTHERRMRAGHVYGMIHYSKLKQGPSDPSRLIPFRASGQPVPLLQLS